MDQWRIFLIFYFPPNKKSKTRVEWELQWEQRHWVQPRLNPEAKNLFPAYAPDQQVSTRNEYVPLYLFLFMYLWAIRTECMCLWSTSWPPFNPQPLRSPMLNIQVGQFSFEFYYLTCGFAIVFCSQWNIVASAAKLQSTTILIYITVSNHFNDHGDILNDLWSKSINKSVSEAKLPVNLMRVKMKMSGY